MLRAIGGLAIFNIVGQILQFAAQPLLARLYAPADFGVVAQVTFLVSICSIIGTFQIHNYLMLEKNPAAREGLESAGYLIAFGFSFSSLVLFYLYASPVFGGGVDMSVPLIASMVLLLTCMANMFRGYLTSVGEFRPMMVYTVARSFFLVSTQCLAGYFSIENGLLYGFVLGELVALCIARPSYFIDSFRRLCSTKWLGAFVALRSNIGFFLTGTVQELVAVAVALLPLYFIGRFFGNELGGLFAMAHKIAWAPILLISQSASSVLYRHLSIVPLEGLARSRVINPIFALLFFIIFSVFAFISMPLVFDLFFDQVWVVSGEMSVWLCLAALSFLAALPARLVYRVLKFQRMQLLIDLIALAAMVVVFALAADARGQIVVRLISLVGVLQNMLHIAVVQIIVRRVGAKFV